MWGEDMFLYPFKKICFETDKSKEEIEQLLSIYKAPLCFEVLYAKEYFEGEVETDKFSLKYHAKNLSGRAGDVFFNPLFYGKVFYNNETIIKVRLEYKFLGWIYHLLLYGVYVLYGFYCILNNKNFISEFGCEFHLFAFIFALIDLLICNYCGNRFLKKFKEVLEIR